MSEEQETETETVVTSDSAEDKLKSAGLYYIWGEIKSGSLKEIHQDVLLKHYQGAKYFNRPLQLVINSEGGDLNETYSLIDLLANVRLHVSTCGFGTVASAGAMLLASGTKGLRTVAANAEIMVHRFSWGHSGQHHELVNHRKPEDDEYARMLRFWLRHSKYNTMRQVERYLLKKEDVWLTPKEALKHGIADQIGGVLR